MFMTHLFHSSVGKQLGYVLLFILAINTASCGLVKPNTNIGELDKLVEMSKGPCMGFCPIYTVTIYTNGVVLYYGERNTNRQGNYIRVLGKSQLSNLKNALKKADLWQYQDLYKGRLPDLQTVTLTYWEEGDFKTIAGKDGRPEVVVGFENQLEEIGNSGEWKKLNQDEEEEKPINEIIVQFEEGVDRDRWITKYGKQNGKIVKQLAPNSLYWLISFDVKKINSQEMLRLIRSDSDIVSAELNKKVTRRN